MAPRDTKYGEAFPGLWIDGKALLQCDYIALMETVDAGIRCAEYTSFIEKLSGK